MFNRITAAGVISAVLTGAAVVNVDPGTRYQSYDGTGISEAFQR
jgi:hypothetical protein